MPEKQIKKKPEPVTREIAGVETDIFTGWFGNALPNPDYILNRESLGKSYALYDEMLAKDPHLFSAVQTRKLGVLSKPWEIVPASGERRDVEICEFVRSVVWNINNFDRDLCELLDAVPKGFAVSEVMWQLRDGAVVIRELLNRDQRRFVFGTDGRPRLKTASNFIEGEPLPPRKFLVHSYAPRYESPYGEAVLKNCYWYWWFKKNNIKFWVTFAEKFGTPTTIGKYPPNTPKEEQDKLLKIIRTLQQETGMIVPDGMVLELLEQQRKSSTDTYQALCDYCDSKISQAVLGQTLTSSEGQHGTQALGKVHQGVRQDYIEADCKSLIPAVNQLIRWLVDFNYGDVVYYPEFVVHYEESQDLKALAERDRILFKELMLPITEDYLYDAYGLPRPTDEQKLLAPAGDAVEELAHGPDGGGTDAAENSGAEENER